MTVRPAQPHTPEVNGGYFQVVLAEHKRCIMESLLFVLAGGPVASTSMQSPMVDIFSATRLDSPLAIRAKIEHEAAPRPARLEASMSCFCLLFGVDRCKP